MSLSTCICLSLLRSQYKALEAAGLRIRTLDRKLRGKISVLIEVIGKEEGIQTQGIETGVMS